LARAALIVGTIKTFQNERLSVKVDALNSRLGITNEHERLSVPNHPFLSVVAISGAGGKQAAVPIRSGDMAGPRLCAEVADKFIAGADNRTPPAAFFVKT
jgi:hypothetical protein